MIDSVMKLLKVEFIYLNTNFDAQDYDTPLNAYLDQSTVVNLRSYGQHQTTLTVNENVGVTNSNLFGLLQAQDDWL